MFTNDNINRFDKLLGIILNLNNMLSRKKQKSNKYSIRLTIASLEVSIVFNLYLSLPVSISLDNKYNRLCLLCDRFSDSGTLPRLNISPTDTSPTDTSATGHFLGRIFTQLHISASRQF